MADDIYIPCPRCGAKNRVPGSKISQRPICGRCRAALVKAVGAAGPLEVTDHNFKDIVLSSPVPFMLDCWAPWCGPCRTIGPIIEQMAVDFGGRISVGKLNVDENPQTASRYGIQSIPTILFFKSGREIDRVVGAVPRAELERRLLSLLG